MSLKAPGKLKDAEPVDMDEFCNYESDVISDSIHIRFDRSDREIALFRVVSRDGSEWVRTDLSDASVNFARNVGNDDPSGFFVTASNADNLLTWLDRLRVERSHPNINLEWWRENNSPMINESDMDKESIFLKYRTMSGRSNSVELTGLYKNEMQMMANF